MVARKGPWKKESMLNREVGLVLAAVSPEAAGRAAGAGRRTSAAAEAAARDAGLVGEFGVSKIRGILIVGGSSLGS